MDRARLWILIVAALLRLAVAAGFPNLHHPDENYQFFEQAHRLAFGYGVLPWEFEDGIRSMLLPSMFAKLFSVLGALGASPYTYIFAARAVLACLSLVVVASVYGYGRRIGPTHAVIGGVVAAIWFELVYFSGRPLMEAIATDFLLTALALASPRSRELRPRTLALIGACVGACLMLRVQLAPGLAVLAVWVCGTRGRARWLPLLAGAALPIALFGISDWLWWGAPFHSQVGAFRVNFLAGKASHYGVEPRGWYLITLMRTWWVLAPLLIALVVVRWRAQAMWIAVAAAIIAAHSLVPHKEYRFVYPAFACLALVAAFGSADCVERLRGRFPRWGRAPLIAACIAWAGTSAALATGPNYAFYWVTDRDLVNAEFALYRQPALCGLLLYGYPWYQLGGYAFLHRHIPIYRPLPEMPLAVEERAANFVLARRSALPELGREYSAGACLGRGAPYDLCIVERPGECSPDPSLPSLLDTRRLGE
jgi:hypothetical protein